MAEGGAQGGERRARTGDQSAGRRALEEGRRQRGFVDRAGTNRAEAGARRVRGSDFVGKPLTRYLGDAATEPRLARFADFGDEHLPNEAGSIAHRSEPPAIAGTIETASPALSSVLRPSRKRMSSSPM